MATKSQEVRLESAFDRHHAAIMRLKTVFIGCFFCRILLVKKIQALRLLISKKFFDDEDRKNIKFNDTSRYAAASAPRDL